MEANASDTRTHPMGLLPDVNLRVAYAPGIPGTFSPPPTSKETASWRPRHTPKHPRHACAIIHVGIANPRWHAQPSILRIW